MRRTKELDEIKDAREREREKRHIFKEYHFGE